MDRKQDKPTLSIVIPLYNEARRMGRGLEMIRTYIDAANFDCEVVLVNDGSTDNTAEIARQAAGDDPRYRIVSYPVNQGKGYAVKTGMLAARGMIRLFADIDMSVPIDRADEFIELIRAGADVVIGTRKTSASTVAVHQPKYREVLGEIFRRSVRAVFAPQITDFTCGFKAFTAHAAKSIFAESHIRRWAFDAEILFLASRWNLDVREIPVTWTDQPGSKVNVMVDVFRSSAELALIRLRWLIGKYRRT